ncbi:hypothetical protein PV721_08725 [Streptomyces sp. MB09-01]|uniref:hypothetical protein n=1 Tax=Streptomyces sp. MB09-01 TaxID=3028666 RepID=UPI0029A025AD|nr:hypothetical protein [Streptomyces sp. MB09-01]MDX3534450.1 hypothetical protein [Streptomyces sp. MB09-01]
MRTRTILRGVAATALTLSALGLGMGTANADERDGYLTETEFGLFCYENQENSVFDLFSGDKNFGDDFFKGSRSCAGQMVNDNTRSYLNRSNCGWYVLTNIDWQGSQGFVPSGYRGNATDTFKDRISSAMKGC